MNREIVFSGKRLDNDEWVEGSHIKGFKTDPNNPSRTIDCEFICWTFCDCIKYYAEVHPETVRQYTGLTDKNGRRIWERDIIQFQQKEDYASDKHTAVIKWQGDYPAFDLDGDHDFDCNALQKILISDDYNYSIIGNLHDNPELLEVEEWK